MYSLPTQITINDNIYSIRNKGDFRMVLDCFSALNDVELNEQFRLYTAMFIFYEDIELGELDDMITQIENLFGADLEKAVSEMYNFFNCGEDSIGARTSYKLIDWEKDEQLLVGAINSVAGTEIRALPYLHWWTFMGYFCNIKDDCALANVTSIRYKIAKGKKLEKYEREFKQNNPQYFVWDRRTAEQKAEDELLESLWNKT